MKGLPRPISAAQRVAPLFTALFAGLPCWVRAAETAAGQTPSLGALLQALLALAVVLAALYAFLWLLRRLSPAQTGPQGVVRVVGGVMLGTRERLVVVEVADQWLLLGVAAGQVSHLHTMAKPEGAAVGVAQAAPSAFAGKLAEFLARRKNG